MADLVNSKTGNIEAVDQDAVPAGFMSGQYGFPLDKPVYLKNPNGEMYTVDPSDVHSAVTQAGYKFPTSNELEDFHGEQTYGKSPGKALAAGAARSATFGLSDLALTKSGLVDPETLAGLEKYNPTANLVGETAGVLGSLAAAPEAKAVKLAGEALSAAKGTESVAAATKALELAKKSGVSQDIAKASEALKSANAEAKIPEHTEALAKEKRTLTPTDILFPTKAISKIGQKTAALFPKGGEGLAGQILARGGAQAAGSAVEGAFYSTGNVVSEAALGDPNLNGQSIMSQIGWGTLLAGGLGGIVGAGEVGLPPIVDKVKSSLSKTYGVIKGLGEDAYAKAASGISGFPEADIKTALENRQFQFESPEVKSKTASEFASALTDQHSKIEDALHTANRDIRPSEIESLMAKDNIDPMVSQKTGYDISQKLEDTIKQLKSEPDNYAGGYAKKLEDISNGLMRDLNADVWSPTSFYKSLNEAKQKLQSLIKYDSDWSLLPMKERNSMSVVNGLSSDLKTVLEDSGVWGKTAIRQAEYNAAQSAYYSAKKQFQKKFMYKVGSEYKADPSKINSLFNKTGDPRGDEAYAVLQHYMDSAKTLTDQIDKTYQELPAKKFDKEGVSGLLDKNRDVVLKAQKQAEVSNLFKSLNQPGSTEGNSEMLAAGALALHNPFVAAAIEGYNVLKNPGKAITRLTNLEKIIQKTAKQIEFGVTGLLKGSGSAIKIGKGEISAGLSKDFARSAKESKKEFEKRIDQVQKLSQNPDILHGKVEDSTRELYSHAPNTSGSIQNTLVSGLSFLASKIPQHQSGGPLGAKWMPNQQEISKFNRYYEAVHNPLSVLKQAANGTLTPEGLETVQSVYPDLYNEMKKQLFNKIIKLKEPMPYRQRQMVSMFMGQNMDGSHSQSMIAGNQMTYMMPSQQQENKPTQAGLSKLTQSERLLTETEKTQLRES